MTLRLTEQEVELIHARNGTRGRPPGAKNNDGTLPPDTRPSSTIHFPRAAPSTSDSLKNLQALGRMKVDEMNKGETRYAQKLECMRYSGQIQWWRFQGMKFRLADGCFYTPDFDVMLANSQLEYHEFKGSLKIVEDDALVKIKVAAEMYPFRFMFVIPNKHAPSGYDTRIFE